MNEEEKFLADYLVKPFDDRGYLEWLGEQANRYEYLRLLAELPEPTTPNPGDLVRERLRAVRGRVDDAWAHRIDLARFAADGLYQSEQAEGWHYLRFSPDGIVCSLRSAEPVHEAWRCVQQPDGGDRGSYALRADRITFSLPTLPSAEFVESEVTRYFAHCGGDYPGLEKEIADYRAYVAATKVLVEYSGVVGTGVLMLSRQSSPERAIAGAFRYRFVTAPQPPEPEPPRVTIAVACPPATPTVPPAPPAPEPVPSRPAVAAPVNTPPVTLSAEFTATWEDGQQKAGVTLSGGGRSVRLVSSEACRLADECRERHPELAAQLDEAAADVGNMTRFDGPLGYCEQIRSEPGGYEEARKMVAALRTS